MLFLFVCAGSIENHNSTVNVPAGRWTGARFGYVFAVQFARLEVSPGRRPLMSRHQPILFSVETMTTIEDEENTTMSPTTMSPTAVSPNPNDDVNDNVNDNVNANVNVNVNATDRRPTTDDRRPNVMIDCIKQSDEESGHRRAKRPNVERCIHDALALATTTVH